MARLAHWATTASRIRKQRKITWHEAIEVYHALGRRTRKDLGRRPGVTDLKTYRTVVVRATNRITTRANTLSDRLDESGFVGADWILSSEALRKAGVSGADLAHITRILEHARRNIERTGTVSPTVKLELDRFIAKLGEKYGVDQTLYFQLQRKLY